SETPAFRHLQLLVRLANGLDQQALVGIAGHDRGARRATLQDRVARIEAEAAVLLIPVAVVTIRGQDRPDSGFEEFGGCRRLRGGLALLRLERDLNAQGRGQTSG